MVLRMANPWKHPKTGVYYLRKHVPLDVTAAVGSAVIKITLNTKDPNEARLRHLAKLTELEAQWSQLRKGVQWLADEQLEALAGEIYQDILSQFSASNRGPAVGHHLALMRFLIEAAFGKFADEPTLQHVLSDRPPADQIEDVIGGYVQTVLSRHGLRLDERSGGSASGEARSAGIQGRLPRRS
jgi:hypothetical protein